MDNMNKIDNLFALNSVNKYNYQIIIANNIKIIRSELGLNLSKFSNLCGIYPSQIGQWEKCSSIPQIKLITKLCISLDCSSDWLIGLTDEYKSLNKEVEDNCFNLFFDRLKYKIKRSNITIQKLGDLLDIPPRSIMNWIYKKAYPRVNFIIKLSIVLDCSSDWLIGLTDREDE